MQLGGLEGEYLGVGGVKGGWGKYIEESGSIRM